MTNSSFVRSSDKRSGRRGRPARLRRGRHQPVSLFLEALEERTLPQSTAVPTPVVTHQGIVSQPFVAPPTTPTILGNLSNPSVAVDPLNSQKIVAFFLDNYPTNKATPSQTMFTLGEYSTNGGVKFKGVWLRPV